MGTVTTSAPPGPSASSRPGARLGSWSRSPLGPWLRPRQVAAWYALFALYAGAVAAFSGPGHDRAWGIWAAFGYAAATALAAAWPGPRGRAAALAAALAVALAGPLAWLALTAPATPDTAVVTRSGVLLLAHGTPYLAPAALAHGGWLAYDPYLPVMALFGLPRALGWPGLAGDPRPWLAAATFLILGAAFATARRRAAAAATGPGLASAAPVRGAALGLAAFAVASPVLAFPLALGITDPPVIALTCLALALLTRPATTPPPPAAPRGVPPGSALGCPGLWPAAVVLGVACAMKYTAWPALAILAVMLIARDGARAATRFTAAAVATMAALSAVLAPAALTAPAALIDNTVLFPLGLTKARSPAQSPLPGHILATLGPAGHLAAIALLITTSLAFAAWLVLRPPADTQAAALRLALGLALMFALSPATRFGYFAYPAALCGWIALSRGRTAFSRSGTAFSRGRAAPDPVARLLRVPSRIRS
jgi:hypothetical protein